MRVSMNNQLQVTLLLLPKQIILVLLALNMQGISLPAASIERDIVVDGSMNRNKLTGRTYLVRQAFIKQWLWVWTCWNKHSFWGGCNAIEDLSFILPAGFALLVLFLCVFLRSVKIASITLGSVGLVLVAEISLLAVFGRNFSVIDAIAIPIIMGVAVDGAFCTHHQPNPTKRFEGCCCLQPAQPLPQFRWRWCLRNQNSTWSCFGDDSWNHLDWFVTRFVLEDIYMNSRTSNGLKNDNVKLGLSLNWLWPVVLLLLTAIALTAPEGVEVLDIHQFMPEDDPALDELEELREKYVIASSTIATLWLTLRVKIQIWFNRFQFSTTILLKIQYNCLRYRIYAAPNGAWPSFFFTCRWYWYDQYLQQVRPLFMSDSD